MIDDYLVLRAWTGVLPAHVLVRVPVVHFLLVLCALLRHSVSFNHLEMGVVGGRHAARVYICDGQPDDHPSTRDMGDQWGGHVHGKDAAYAYEKYECEAVGSQIYGE